MTGRRWAAGAIGIAALGVATWGYAVGRRLEMKQGAELAAGQAAKIAEEVASAAFATAANEAATAASVAQVKAALRSGVDALTIEDLFATEDWWLPYRDRAVTIAGATGGLVARPAHQTVAAEVLQRARAAGSAAAVAHDGAGIVLLGAAIVDGVPHGLVLTLSRPLNASLLREWARGAGARLAITDGQRALFGSDETADDRVLVGREARRFVPLDGGPAGAAVSLGTGVWLWALRPVTRLESAVATWPWILAGICAMGAVLLAWSGRKRIPDGPRTGGSGTVTVPGGLRERMSIDAPTFIASRPETQAFGRYALLDRIGEGGMCEIYTAALNGAEGFQRTVVIKRLKPELAHNRVAVDQFIDEAKLGSVLAHSNIVQVFDFGKVEGGGGYFMALEYIVGRNFGQVIERHVGRLGATLDPAMIFYVAHQILEALGYAHNRASDDGVSLGIVHRDVSPGNIVVAEDGKVKLIDFGIVKADYRVSKTDIGHVIKGNPAFMAPEQARGQVVDARADLFSLGLVMYHALTNEVMYGGSSSAETLYRAATGPQTHDLRRIETLPEPAATILRRALAPELADRYQKAEAFAADLAPLLRPGIKAELATLVNALFGLELRPRAPEGTAPQREQTPLH